MNKFKVGDKVKGMDGIYTVTDERMTEGVVTYVLDDTFIRVLVLEHEIKEFIGRSHIVEAKYFELIDQKQPTRIVKLNGLKIVYNPPYTIVTDGTFKGKAKCNPADEYDPIEGLIIAAERFDEAKKPKGVKFKIGDKVRITGMEGCRHCFEKGDMGTVIKPELHYKDRLCIERTDGISQWIDRCDYEHV